MSEFSSEETQRALAELADEVDPAIEYDIDLPSFAKDLTRMTCFTDAKLAERDAAIEARVRAEVAEEIARELTQKLATPALNGTQHWDSDVSGAPAWLITMAGNVARRHKGIQLRAAAGSSPDTTPGAPCARKDPPAEAGGPESA